MLQEAVPLCPLIPVLGIHLHVRVVKWIRQLVYLKMEQLFEE